MVKKCMICGEEAIYKIKDTPDYYCPECAEENFSDLDMLVKVEEEAQKLKNFLKEKMEDIVHTEEELDKMIVMKEKNEDVQDN
ncbi:hypothetical protein HOE37_05125 [Candidatus Woesearchaeota archaeon]|jgi:hypothetical protein|nr:hypothetical protein [Candidatus Woesearchaeota archaeon]MBT4111214.1 hypothetical protein [Candidatus Woesearchaeota archaeon]MBT4336794.1 hypothetical protein [Candidatus Woesearchaeota archaeon]MBT4469462.1 hypothetical protein [Candidatus Woesearchaeota archaeon]MBT6744143.1 hypothetical protein [Candidatus Woesearchaeota archaeon]